jgi:hypothetical protein
MDLTLMRPLETEEIPGVLLRASCFGGRLSQTGCEVQLSSVIRDIELREKKVVFTLHEAQDFERDRPLFINLAYRDLSFKLEAGNFKLKGKQIHTFLPREAKALQVRDGQRHILPVGSIVSCQLSRAEVRTYPRELALKLADVSLHGLGATLMNYEEGCLVANDHVWIREINGQRLEQPVFGRVVYVLPRRYVDKVEARVGISLSTPLPAELFEELKRQCLLVLGA